MLLFYLGAKLVLDEFLAFSQDQKSADYRDGVAVNLQYHYTVG